MDLKITNRLLFIQNRCTICLFEKCKNSRKLQNFTWPNISRIIYFYDDCQLCSICFSKCFLPRMDRCGHIFCLGCILNLFKHCNAKCVLCPLCKDVDIHLSSVKRVVFVKNKMPEVGETITLDLLVKNKNDIAPRIAHKLSRLSNNSVPNKKLPIAKFVGVAFERNQLVLRAIRSDIEALKGCLKKKTERVDKCIYGQTMAVLNAELADFQNDIVVGEKMNVHLTEHRPPADEWFNLLNWRCGGGGKLFYQCGRYRNCFLDDADSARLMETAAADGQLPPIAVTATVASVRCHALDEQRHGRMDHLIVGARVVVVRLQPESAALSHIDHASLAVLRRHLNKLVAAEKQLEEKKQQIAQRASERKLLPSVMRHRSTSTKNCGDKATTDGVAATAASTTLIAKRPETLASGLNTCLLGIECVAPDDDYPHAESCVHFKQPESHPSPEDSNVATEKYFGVLRRKLNVYHSEQQLLQGCELMMAALNCKDKDSKKNVEMSRNYPPEIIPKAEVIHRYQRQPLLQLQKAPNGNATLDAYMVQKACGTQLQMKKRKRAMKNAQAL